MKTAVKMEANPIHVRIASFPSVRMLAANAVSSAAISVQTTVQTLPFARTLKPCARPKNPEPVASLFRRRCQSGDATSGQSDLHPSQEKQPSGNFSSDWSAHYMRSVGNGVNAFISHTEGIHDVRVICCHSAPADEKYSTGCVAHDIQRERNSQDTCCKAEFHEDDGCWDPTSLVSTWYLFERKGEEKGLRTILKLETPLAQCGS